MKIKYELLLGKDIKVNFTKISEFDGLYMFFLEREIVTSIPSHIYKIKFVGKHYVDGLDWAIYTFVPKKIIRKD